MFPPHMKKKMKLKSFTKLKIYMRLNVRKLLTRTKRPSKSPSETVIDSYRNLDMTIKKIIP